MYFSLIPDVQYDKKPTKFPFSSTEYIIAKNFFRRFKVNEDMFSYSVFFNKYAVQDGDRLDLLAERYYGSPFYDWVIVLVNNLINPITDWPMDEYSLRKHVEKKYSNPDAIHHYETIEIQDGNGKVVLKSGLTVDQTFYNSTFKYFDSSLNTVTSIPGSSASYSVNNYEYESKLNEKNRELYILKDRYFDAFVDEFRKLNLYLTSSDYISKQLKKTAV